MGFTDVWRDIDFYEEKRYHPTQKPIKLIKRLIYASSNKGDIVFDPFVGSGSTAVAAVQLERDFLGFEIEKKYYEIAVRRIDGLRSVLFNVADSDSAVGSI